MSPDFVNHSYDYRPNWTPLSPVAITYPLDIDLSRGLSAIQCLNNQDLKSHYCL